MFKKANGSRQERSLYKVYWSRCYANWVLVNLSCQFVCVLFYVREYIS